jgi:acetyl esterase/lipase
MCRELAPGVVTLGDVDPGRVAAVGHSAGGHLATWAAGRAKLPTGAPGAGPLVPISGVVSLAGVVDLVTGAHEGIGNRAVSELLRGGPEQWPERYAVADPLGQVPIPAAVRCVHARHDDRVPFAQSVAYIEAAQAAGQDASLLEVDGDHFTVTDTSASSWPRIITTLEELGGTG